MSAVADGLSAASAAGAGKAEHEHRRQQYGERGWDRGPYGARAQVLPAEETPARHDRDRAPGTPVPPERTLAAEFDTSRTTVRQALQELVVEGRLERIQGKGTFVAKPKVSQALQLTSYTEDMRAQGLEPTSQLLDLGYITADDRLAGLLDITAAAGCCASSGCAWPTASPWPSRPPTSVPSASRRCAAA